MLSETEKAYYQALTALRQKEYAKAVASFEKAAEDFGTNSEFNLLYQSTRVLFEIKRELAATAGISSEKKELIING